MSEDEIVAFLSAADTRRVFLCRLTDGTEVEMTDPWVRRTDGKRECIATVCTRGCWGRRGRGWGALCRVG